MEDLKEKLDALDAKFRDYCKSHGYDVERDNTNAVKAGRKDVMNQEIGINYGTLNKRPDSDCRASRGRKKRDG